MDHLATDARDPLDQVSALALVNQLNEVHTELNRQRLDAQQPLERGLLVRLLRCTGTLDGLTVSTNGWLSIWARAPDKRVVVSVLPSRDPDDGAEDEERQTQTWNEDKQKQRC